MLIKVMRSSTSQYHRVCDVSRKIRYLVAGRDRSKSAALIDRLAGPPYTRNLVQRMHPFGESLSSAATDIATQLVEIVLAGSVGVARPHLLYRHIVVSVAPRYRARNALCPSEQVKSGAEGTYSGMRRIALDAVKLMGVDEKLPLYLVVHSDQRHLHAHALIGVRAPGAEPLSDFKNRSVLARIARLLRERYELAPNEIVERHMHNSSGETQASPRLLVQ